MKSTIILAKIYLVYSIVTDTMIWGGGLYYLLGGWCFTWNTAQYPTAEIIALQHDFGAGAPVVVRRWFLLCCSSPAASVRAGLVVFCRDGVQFTVNWRGGASCKAKCKCEGVACAKISAKASSVKSFFQVNGNLIQTGKSLPAPVYMQRIAMSSVFAGFAQIMLDCVSLR